MKKVKAYLQHKQTPMQSSTKDLICKKLSLDILHFVVKFCLLTALAQHSLGVEKTWKTEQANCLARCTKFLSRFRDKNTRNERLSDPQRVSWPPTQRMVVLHSLTHQSKSSRRPVVFTKNTTMRYPNYRAKLIGKNGAMHCSTPH